MLVGFIEMDTVISLTIVKNRSELTVLKRLLMSVSIMAALVIGKRLSRKNGVDGVIVRLGYSGIEDKELAHNIQEVKSLQVIPYGVYLYTYMLKMKQMLRMMLNRLLNS